MLRKYWKILIVDDEPDVLAVSKIATKNIICYGIPVKVHTCSSKAEAVEYFQENAHAENIAVAIIDVIMENDKAGLELCDFIRNEYDNWDVPLLIRTGQPGLFPEKEVIDKYEINGYVAKVDATEDRLYSLLKSSIRQFLMIKMYSSFIHFPRKILRGAISREALATAIADMFKTFTHDKNGQPLDYMNENWRLMIDDFSWSGGTYQNGVAALEAMRYVEKSNSQTINANGDTVIYSDHKMMLSLAKTNDAPDTNLVYLLETDMLLPAIALQIMVTTFQFIRDLWLQTPPTTGTLF